MKLIEGDFITRLSTAFSIAYEVNRNTVRNRYMLRTLIFVGCSELTWPLKQKWFWMLFFTLLAAVLGAFVIVELIFALSPGSIIVALVVVLFLWVILRSYRKWVADKSDENGEAENEGSEDIR